MLKEKYVITISMEDKDIGCEVATISVNVVNTIDVIESLISDAFEDYDCYEEGTEKFREDGWGICTFIDYLKYRFPDWNIEDVNSDLTVNLLSEP